jgi:adenylate cyclase
MRALRFGVAARLMAGLTALALFTAAAGAIAVVSFEEFRDSFDRVATTQIDTMDAAARLERQGEVLTGLAPRLFVQGLEQGSLLAFTADSYAQQATLRKLIDQLAERLGDSEALTQVNEASASLFRNTDELATVIFERAATQDDLTDALMRLGELTANINRSLRSFGTASRLRGDGVETPQALAHSWLQDANALGGLALAVISARAPDRLDTNETEATALLQSLGQSVERAETGASQLRIFHTRLFALMLGPSGIISLQRALLDGQGQTRRLLAENEKLSRDLVEAVEAMVAVVRTDIVAENETLGGVLADRSRIMAGLGLLGLVGACGIAAYFQFSVVRRLNRLRNSMRSEQSGESVAELTQGHDEISEMARSFVFFVDEINRRDADIRRSEHRLTNAIESISDGFSLYDSDDLLVLANSRYTSLLYPGLGDRIRAGRSFAEIIREAATRGLIKDAEGRVDAWVADRIADHRNPRGTVVQQRGDNRWIEIKERRTDEGDTVAIYADITERLAYESEILEGRQRTEEANRRVTEQNTMLEQLSNQLSKYLSPQVYSSIFSGAQQVGIASKRKKLTIFFSDIAGFTETTENLESEELTSLLNSYLTEMSRIALDHGATVDKYIGDAILIFFGDPESLGVREDALACVAMAVAMQRRMRELQDEWRDRGLEKPFELRIGINTGYCTVGNFGSEARMDYTIIGREVNLAARLQAKSDVGGILLAHETYSLVKDDVAAEEREPVSVKGFARPIRNYSIGGIYDDAPRPDVIRSRGEGFRLDLDIAKMDEAERAGAIRELEAVLGRLRQPSDRL